METKSNPGNNWCNWMNLIPCNLGTFCILLQCAQVPGKNWDAVYLSPSSSVISASIEANNQSAGCAEFAYDNTNSFVTYQAGSQVRPVLFCAKNILPLNGVFWYLNYFKVNKNLVNIPQEKSPTKLYFVCNELETFQSFNISN